jgi:hypothetical protein
MKVRRTAGFGPPFSFLRGVGRACIPGIAVRILAPPCPVLIRIVRSRSPRGCAAPSPAPSSDCSHSRRSLRHPPARRRSRGPVSRRPPRTRPNRIPKSPKRSYRFGRTFDGRRRARNHPPANVRSRDRPFCRNPLPTAICPLYRRPTAPDCAASHLVVSVSRTFVLD